MRIALGFFVLLCLGVVGLGVHLVLDEQRRVSSLSVPTTATVLEKRLETRVDYRADIEYRTVLEPVVKYRYHAQGRQFTSDQIFPHPFRMSGNLAFIVAKAPLDRFEVGQESAAYYNPDDPADACLIRRPSVLPYLVTLLPVIIVSGLLAYFWRSAQPGGVEFKRRKGRWIAALWHLVGLASAGHYFYLARADYGGGALTLFGVYTQLGLIPVAFALPPSESTGFTRRVKGGIGCSLFGLFVGFWLGLLAAWLAIYFSASATFRLQCWGYGMGITAALFALLGLIVRWQVGDELESPRDRYSRPESVPEPDGLVLNAPAAGPIPYHIDERPMPTGEDLETLLPAQVGPFRRSTMDDPDDVRNRPIYARYRCGGVEIFVELGICGDPPSAQRGVETSKRETEAEFPEAAQLLSLKTEPSFFKTHTPLGAFMSWTRGGYYFSAHARSGEKDLDRFMEAFPY